MTPDEEKKVWEILKLNTGRTTSLFRMALQQKAQIETLKSIMSELISKHSEISIDASISEIETRIKALHQKLLEEIENEFPARAAELDKRKPGDII